MRCNSQKAIFEIAAHTYDAPRCYRIGKTPVDRRAARHKHLLQHQRLRYNTLSHQTRHRAPMQLEEYQQLAARTLGRDRTHEQQLANAALGLTGEAGEVAEVIKKHLFHATPLDKDALMKELGDCLWYIAAFGTVLGFSLDDIAERNVDKLRKRYPEGFDTERSRNRTE